MWFERRQAGFYTCFSIQSVGVIWLKDFMTICTWKRGECFNTLLTNCGHSSLSLHQNWGQYLVSYRLIAQTLKTRQQTCFRISYLNPLGYPVFE